MEVTAAYVLKMTCAAYHTVLGVGAGGRPLGETLHRTDASVHTWVPHAYGGRQPSVLIPERRGRYVNESMLGTVPHIQTHFLVSHSATHTRI